MTFAFSAFPAARAIALQSSMLLASGASQKTCVSAASARKQASLCACVGVATMTENSPHDGEMHPDGDEVLYLINGRVRVTIETSPVQVLDMLPGDGAIVPKGVWHKVDILDPSQIVYLTPGPGGEYRPLPDDD